MLKETLSKIKTYGIKISFKYVIYESYRRLIKEPFFHSYSQGNEDLVIDEYFKYKKSGFYVDIGAYDPNRFSNTKRFYLKGWRGINIEPDLKNYKKFVSERPEDINLNIGICDKKTTIKFHRFQPDTLSTFSDTESERYVKQGYKLVDNETVDVDTLSNVLGKYTENRKIDFFSIDTEGMDELVLKGNDWNRFRPELICIETVDHGTNEEDRVQNARTISFMKEINYEKIWDNGLNTIYRDTRQK